MCIFCCAFDLLIDVFELMTLMVPIVLYSTFIYILTNIKFILMVIKLFSELTLLPYTIEKKIQKCLKL